METTAKIEDLSLDQLEALLEQKRAARRTEQDKERAAYLTLKNDTVNHLVNTAKQLNEAMANFKQLAFKDANTIYSLLKDYSQRHADGKGNFSVANDADDMRLTYKRQGKPSFDERADMAELHIIDFVNGKFHDDKDTRDLIMSLLERKNGNLDIDLIQKLYKMEDRFDDENWKKGIQLLKESYSYNHSKDYIRFEVKDQHGEWESIVLNFSNV